MKHDHIVKTDHFIRSGCQQAQGILPGNPRPDADRVKETESWRVQCNGKLVTEVDRDIEEFRQELVEKGVPMKEIKSYPGFPYLLCDGEDPDGNVFQLSKDVPHS